jgi:sulfopyruvate decarboxylase TPP-binding subunit
MIGVPTTELKPFLKDKEYIVATDEGSAVGYAVGYYLATGKPETVFMGADGFMNALNALTSLVIPYDIPINWVISVGRTEEWHTEASNIAIKYAQGKSNFKLIR